MNEGRFHLGRFAMVGLLLFLWIDAAAEQLPKGDCDSPKPRTDLRHCVFWNIAFSGIDLHGALLDGVSLRMFTMTRVNPN